MTISKLQKIIILYFAKLQGEDNVLVLQIEVIVRLVSKIHENNTNII